MSKIDLNTMYMHITLFWLYRYFELSEIKLLGVNSTFLPPKDFTLILILIILFGRTHKLYYCLNKFDHIFPKTNDKLVLWLSC